MYLKMNIELISKVIKSLIGNIPYNINNIYSVGPNTFNVNLIIFNCKGIKKSCYRILKLLKVL